MDAWTRVSWPLETRFSTYLLPKFPTRGWGGGGGGLGHTGFVIDVSQLRGVWKY